MEKFEKHSLLQTFSFLAVEEQDCIGALSFSFIKIKMGFVQLICPTHMRYKVKTRRWSCFYGGTNRINVAWWHKFLLSEIHVG